MVDARASAALSAIESFILDQVPVGVVATDLAGVVHAWNRFAEDLFGWSADEAIGRNVRDLIVAPADVDATAHTLDAVRRGEAWRGELTLHRKDGTRVECEVTLSPLPDAEGSIVGIVGATVDITRRKLDERRIAARTAVTQLLAVAEDIEGAAPRILEAVCGNLGWRVGVFWAIDEARHSLRPVAIWRDPTVRVDAFVDDTMARTMREGEGLPGRVWETAQPVWISDVTGDATFARGASAVVDHLHTAFATPVVLGGTVLGVLEFFTDQTLEQDDGILHTMSIVGSQVGQFMERTQAEREVRESEARMRAVLDATLDSVISMDADGNVVEFNPAAERTFGYSREEALGQQMCELIIPEEFRERHRAGLKRFLETGEGPIIGTRVELTAVRRDGSRLPVELSVNKVDLPGGVLFTGSVRDITERKRSEERQRFLADAGTVLAAAVLEYEEVLARLADLAVPRLADWCSIAVVQDDGSLKTIRVAHVDPEKVHFAEELGKRYPPDPNAPRGPGNVIRTGRPEIYPEIPDEMLAAGAVDAEHLAILRSLAIRSGLVVPLIARNRTLGTITLAYAESGRRYDEDDLALAQELARRAALAVDNARLYTERDHIARTLQASLLPPELPAIPGMQVAARYRAAGEGNEVGGDFYDVFETGDGGWAVIIGDVCGKGPEAAAVTGLARYTMRAAAMKARKPSDILTTLNDAIVQQRSDYTFCTVTYVRVRPGEDNARMTISCAGHPLPFILRADGRIETAGQPGTLLGVFPDPELADVSVDLASGDAIVLFTDGVIEEHGEGRVFGRDGLADVLHECIGRDAEAIAEAVDRAVIGFRNEAPRDDVAILVLKAVR